MAPLPSQIGRYEIKSLIGRGGMGDLYLAHDPNTNRLVALKLLNATLDSNEMRERFAREARALAALNHPNIVNIYDTGEFDDSPFIVMEYVRGETLAELIKRRSPLSVSQKLKLISELCAGLAQAHEAGIIHRDIKPANLMVDQQGRLKILDFGIARVAESNKTRLGPLTQLNMMIGTPGYMSPEQIEGGEVDHRSDIFAVGAVCYELLSYDEAFAGADTRQIERRVLQGQPAPLASVVPGLDPEIDEVVLRALKRDPNKRYQDAATFERAIERLRARLAPEAAEAPPRPTPPPPQTSKGKSHEARAEAAYQRALAAYQGGAHDAARRFTVEALAEDPSHVKARALLARLEARALRPETHVAAPPPVEPTEVSTSVSNGAPTKASAATIASTSVGRGAPTIASAPTLISPSAAEPPPTFASAPTILVSPGAGRAPARRKAYETLWGKDAPLKKRYDKLWTADHTASKQPPSLWARYRWAALAVALLVLVAGLVAIVVRFGVGLRPSRQLLTITRPTGGTLTASGINCGTRGSDCSIERPSGDPIELRPEADAGFTFVGYTGDCAPGGRTTMTAPRTCGATFERGLPPADTQAKQLLTIAPVPTGGTIEGVDLLCGSKGSVCSVSYPDGVPVELRETADPGFTFMGFAGDCTPGGHTQMVGPRTCTAKFSPTAIAEAQPRMPVAPSGGSRGRDGRGTPPSTPTTVDAPPAPSVGRGSPQSPAAPAAPPAPRAPIEIAPPGPQAPVAPPPTDEAFAKGKIQEVLKEYCSALEAIDPAAVQRVQPKIDISSLRNQLNKSRYKSVQCKFGDPTFDAVDAAAGTAKVHADLKRVYDYTILKPETIEQIADIVLSRSGPRSDWKIDTIGFKPKPK
jgi:serine/threonine protein kinase